MMQLNINNSKMVITDDNKTIVSKDIAEEINQNLKVTDAGANKQPELIVAEDKK